MDNTAKSHSKAIAPKQSECKKMRYSIRKVATVGATSALIGTFAFLGVSHVKADQVTETASSVATTTTEKSTVSIALASETETSTATSEVVNSSSTHSEVETTVTTTQSSKTSSPITEDKASSTAVSSSPATTSPVTTEATVSTSESSVEAPTPKANTGSAATHTELALKLSENSAANANLNKLNGRIKSIVEDTLTSDQIVALTEEEIKALNKVDFSDNTIKGTGTSLTYRNLKDIVASFLKQDSKLAVPYFKADTIINMPAFNTVDAQTMEKEEIDVWDSWPVQDAESGLVSNWNGYQLVIAMAGAPKKNSNHIYLLYSKYGDNDFTHWKNAGPIFGYDALEDDQQWSGSATVNSDGSIQLFYTMNDTSAGKLNWQQLASATLNLAVENDDVVLKSVENDHILFDGDNYHYQSYPKFMDTFNDDHNHDGIPDRADNYCLRDPHIIEDKGSRYLIFESNTGDENYQGEKQVYTWSNYGGDDAFNLKSFLNIINNKHLYDLASWANGSIGILKLDDNEKNPSVAELYTPLVTSHMVTDEVERPSVVKMGNKYYLFAASRISKSTDAEGTVAVRGAVGDDVVMLGFVSDSLRGKYRPLNGSGVVLTASVPADWRTSTYSYYAVPVEGSSDTLLVTSYMTNRGGVAGAENKSTWAPSFLIKMNADDTTEVLPKMTNQGDWIWDQSSESLVHVGDQDTAKLPNEDFKVDYHVVSSYGLKPHTYPAVAVSTGVSETHDVLTVTVKDSESNNTGKSEGSVSPTDGNHSADDKTKPTDGNQSSVDNVDKPTSPTNPDSPIRRPFPYFADRSANEGEFYEEDYEEVPEKPSTGDTTSSRHTVAQATDIVTPLPEAISSSEPAVPATVAKGGISTEAESPKVTKSHESSKVEVATKSDKVVKSEKTDTGKDNTTKVAAKLAITPKTPSVSEGSNANILTILATIFAAIASLSLFGYGLVTGKIQLPKK